MDLEKARWYLDRPIDEELSGLCKDMAKVIRRLADSAVEGVIAIATLEVVIESSWPTRCTNIWPRCRAGDRRQNI